MTTAQEDLLVAPGHYLTDGLHLVYVVRIDNNGSAMVEDAVSGALFYIEPGDYADWKRVRCGA